MSCFVFLTSFYKERTTKGRDLILFNRSSGFNVVESICTCPVEYTKVCAWWRPCPQRSKKFEKKRPTLNFRLPWQINFILGLIFICTPFSLKEEDVHLSITLYLNSLICLTKTDEQAQEKLPSSLFFFITCFVSVSALCPCWFVLPPLRILSLAPSPSPNPLTKVHHVHR
jgi:hypothetical protein